MRKHILQGRLIGHSAILLALCILPFMLGFFRIVWTLALLMFVIWPAVSFLSPFRLALCGSPRLVACAPVVVFLLVPLFALLTPAEMDRVGIFLVFYIIACIAGGFIGGWRANVRNHRTHGTGMGL